MGPEVPLESAAELRALVGAPPQRAIDKVHTALTADDRGFLERARMCVVATSAADGGMDASPKGDPAGSLVHVVDEHTIAIPERPGNKRVDGYLNILERPGVGLLFIVPGQSTTLRVNGRGRLVRDAEWFDDLAVRGRRPLLALVVDIDEVFGHCAKAFVRSGVWDPTTWGLPPERALAVAEADVATHTVPLY